MELSTVIVSAYAKAPQNTGYYEINKYIGLVLEIDKETHEIVKSSGTFITDLARDYINRLLVGTNIITGVDALIKKVQTHYIVPSQQAIIMAVKIAQQRYLDALEK